jgi:hypothetical protein
MGEAHRPSVPFVLEQLLDGLEELGNVLGDAGRAALPVIRTRLIEAVAARDRGDPVGSLRALSAAMADLTALADRLDPFESRAMRLVAERFQTALLRGDLAEAKQGLDVMFERSGARRLKSE